MGGFLYLHVMGSFSFLLCNHAFLSVILDWISRWGFLLLYCLCNCTVFQYCKLFCFSKSGQNNLVITKPLPYSDCSRLLFDFLPFFRISFVFRKRTNTRYMDRLLGIDDNTVCLFIPGCVAIKNMSFTRRQRHESSASQLKKKVKKQIFLYPRRRFRHEAPGRIV